nr:3'(2'),5'-bisphosphate nucleotidase CysQ [Oceaniglobus trochenteri]
MLCDAVRGAGMIALGHWRDDPQTWHKPEGAGPVTEADLAANAHLHACLHPARPDYGWLSEESDHDPARLTARRCFIVDPIDGTRAFIAGQSAWAVSVAVATEGQITAAAVFLPAQDKLYTAAIGQGAHLNGAPIRASAASDPDSATILATKPTLAPEHWRGTPPAKRHHRPSLAYRLCLVAEGRFDAMLSLHRTWEWDIAAASLIVTEAGGTATTRRGAPLAFNQAAARTDGCLAAAPDLHGPLLRRLA